MAVQIETQGQLAEFLEILSRRRWQLFLPALLLLTLGGALAVFIPKKYLVSTQVEVRPVSVGSTGKEAENAPNQIRADERIRKVLEQLKNPRYLALQATEQDQFVKDVQNDLKVKTDKPTNATSSFVTVEYTHVDVHWAMEFLRALRDDWKKDVLDRDRNRVADEEARANEAVAALEAELKKEEEELSRTYQKNNISPTQPIPGGKDQRAEDPNFDRLQKARDLKAQYELDLGRAENMVTHLEKVLADTPPTLREEQLLEGASHSAEVVEIDKQISAKQDELATYKPANKKYRLIEKEIEALERNKETIKKLATRSELQSVAKPNPRYAQIQQQLDDARLARDTRAGDLEKLDKAILEGSQDVDRLYLVFRDVRLHSTTAERLTKELEAAVLKRDDKAMLARQLASRLNDPFSITQDVREPLKPTEPNPWLIVAFALVAGLALGLSIALSAEYGRNCFRSVHDISRVMVAPVLGSVGRIRTRRERRARSLRRSAVGLVSAGVICSVAFVTWAWARNPELLSPQLRARIEHLRDKLR